MRIVVELVDVTVVGGALRGHAHPEGEALIECQHLLLRVEGLIVRGITIVEDAGDRACRGRIDARQQILRDDVRGIVAPPFAHKPDGRCGVER